MKAQTTALSALVLALTLSACATYEDKPAATPSQAVPKVTAEEGGMVSDKGDAAIVVDLITVSATVKSVDLATRMVTLIGADGKTFVVKADEEVRNLPQVKPGDRVKLEFYEGIAAQLNPPGTPASSPTLTKEMVRAAPGQRPGAAVGAVVTKTVVIDSIDTATNVVTFHEATLPNQHPLTVAVKRPQFQAMLKTLKPGDQVSLSFFEALAVSVQPVAK
jgi:Cu/Ag efflux protein CusF